MSKEKDKIFRTLEHIAITFDKFGYSPTIPIFKGHQDFEWLFKLELDTIKALCNQQDQRISELEEQLKNAIVPKFKVGQTVWYIYGKSIKSFTISEIEVEIRLVPLITYSNPYIYQYEENCFATKEEAQAKLEELRGNNVKDN